jgi:hypothetical protein
MRFFDRFAAKPAPETGATTGITPSSGHPTSAVKPRLAAARARLDTKDLPGAMAIYEEILGGASAGGGAGGASDRADVLVAISGDLGMHGHVAEIVELIAPRYDADRHGPATGLNLLQAYLALGNADAAQHVLDILFALNRPDLEDRLHGFSNALAELLAKENEAEGPASAALAREGAPKIGLITIGKPIWFYGLEPMAAQLLPPKAGRLRRVAFAQLALPGRGTNLAALPENAPAEDELGRLARALPLWLAETFYFSSLYAPVAAIGHLATAPGVNRYIDFGAEWSLENLRQLVETTEGGLDYVFTGALRAKEGDYELVLRVWEVKSFRERKAFSARWTPATADAALAQLLAEVRAFMEWSPAGATLAFEPAARPRAWLDTLGASLGLFLLGKNILPREQLAPVAEDLRAAGDRAGAGEIAALAWLTLRARAAQLGFAPEAEPPLAPSTLVTEAARVLAR